MPLGNLVNEAQARLREWLATTGPKRGARLPSERALATELGLQHYAVNRAMARLIVEGLVERDGYKLIAAGTPDIATSFHCHLVIAQRSVYIPSYRRIAKEAGIKLIINSWESSDEAALKLERLDVRETEAVIFDPPRAGAVSVWEPVATRLAKHDIPVVCIGHDIPGLFSVQPDTKQSLQLALLHLVQLGHAEVGLIIPASATPDATANEIWEELCRNHNLTTSKGRIHAQHNMRLREEANEVASMLVNEWREATALIFVTTPDCNMQILQDQLHHKGRRIPEHLSLVFIGDSKVASSASPSITSVSADIALVQETAFFLAQRAARKKKAMGILPPACSLLVQAQLTVRHSTRALITADAPDLPPNTTPPVPRSNGLTVSQAKAPAPLESSLRKAYPLAARAFLSERVRFAPIDLQPYVNRPFNFRRGWLGDLPLKQLTPGPHEIHGVPFNILGGPKRSDCGTVVFHSAVNTTGNAHKLPDRLRIPIGSKAQAVYILHGCGYAKFLHAFAHYDFQSRSTSLDRVPLVSLGQPPADYDPSLADANAPRPNIQDWWPDFPHTDFPQARMAPISSPSGEDHVSRYVFLYTLEWINPSPQTIVSYLDITVDTTHSTTLGVLAITVLKP